jgi:hypothetical protein
MALTAIINDRSNISIFSKKIAPKPNVVYETYWRFAAERQEIFFKRYKAQKSPWTKDKILALFKFTNAYRASDRVSQYLIKNIIYSNDRKPEDVFFRILLFKLFNKIETWEALEKHVGDITFETYNFKTYNKILESIRNNGEAIYSGAYIMASGNSAYGQKFKHQNHLKLLEAMMIDKLPEKIQSMPNMETLYNTLLSYPTIGSFLAYQFSIDINYSDLTNFSEMEFVKAGPGAKDGIRKCFEYTGDYSEEDIIRMMADKQNEEFERLELNFKSLWGRPLQLIDCQNLFCEVDKYSRVAHPEISGISDRKRIKQKFTPTSLTSIEYCFPKKWGINLA